MQIDLAGKHVELHGFNNPVTAALRSAIADNGGILDSSAALPDILILSLSLIPKTGTPETSTTVDALLAEAETVGFAMAQRGTGRLLFILSAIAGMPMRRHPEYSRCMAAVLATVRTLAMQLGPHVLVNAVGAGAIGDPLVAGDNGMLSHASIKRSGTVAEVVDTALFFCDPLNTYTTGQMLAVDGGWSAGYGRSF